MAFYHEYSCGYFDTREEAEEDLRECIDLDDITDAGNFNEYEIVRRFARRKSNDEFCNWMEDKMCEAEDNCMQWMINEVETDEDEKDVEK